MPPGGGGQWLGPERIMLTLILVSTWTYFPFVLMKPKMILATIAGGMTGTAVLAVLAASILTAGMDLFSQKSAAATLIDAGYIAAMGAIMLLAHAIF